ncbi:MAG: chromosome segregation SMC family protein [Candidatus Actinomarina sp.]
MYLKSVNINGFKSFSENTNIDFSNKVNVVVGPNGSGKSNVVDAISWVLGTQSPASLRTNKMEDVIFAGTDKLAQKGFAEVNLNFDVDAEKFNGTEEISIGRKLYRDGQSEYFMNGLNCRLLDVQEFLSDVGIGRQQHTIISQGQIAEILNSKPEDHRITIEEASGILPFKLKKDKALRRIESGEKEIKRAKDVLKEIKKQLKPLKEQADQALIHEKSVNELKKLKIELNILNYKKYNSKNERIQKEIVEINEGLDDLTKSINKQKKLKNKINNNLGESISLGSLYKDTSNKVLNNAEKIKNIAQIANERIDNLERSEIQFKNDRESKKVKILNNSNLVSSLSIQLISKKNNLKDKTTELEILNNELLDIVKKLSLNIEVNEALIENEIKYLNEYIKEKENNQKRIINNLDNFKKDKEESKKLITTHENILNINNIDNKNFNDIKNKIYYVFHREIENIEKNNVLNLNNLDSKNNMLEQKNDQLKSINDKDHFKEELEIQKNKISKDIEIIERNVSNLSNQIISTTEKIKFLNDENAKLADEVKYLNNSNNSYKIEELKNLSFTTIDLYQKLKDASNLLNESGQHYEYKYGDNNKNIIEIENEIEKFNNKYFKLKDQKSNLQITKSEYSNESLNFYSYLINIEGFTLDQINNYDITDLDENEIIHNIKTCEDNIEKIGVVNYLAKEDYDSLNTRYKEIKKSIEDLLLTKNQLNSHIKEIESEIIFRIESSFNSISINFSEIFEKLFPGGVGSLKLTNKENLLETGIEINAQPRGKKVKKLSLLSGGERSLAAIAFLFAIFKSFPSPFYILDEVEAALDDANLHRMIDLLNYLKNDAQFVIVTHQQQTMHAGDILYGVTMEPGSGSRIFIKTKEDFESLVSKDTK